MKSNQRNILAAVLACSAVYSASARPIEFSEVSLLVRAHESDAEIVQQVHARKLLHRLTVEQEDLLSTQGANPALIRNLRDAGMILSTTEANAFAVDQQTRAKNIARPAAAPASGTSLGGKVKVFDVSYGYPVNLSRWGGPDCQIRFQCRRFAGEDIIEPAVIDSGSRIDTATYLGAGRPDDATTLFDQRNYLSVMAHESARSLAIDTSNPLTISGVPYMLYPVYEGRGASLYYIGKAGGSVRLAVVASD